MSRFDRRFKFNPNSANAAQCCVSLRAQPPSVIFPQLRRLYDPSLLSQLSSRWFHIHLSWSALRNSKTATSCELPEEKYLVLLSVDPLTSAIDQPLNIPCRIFDLLSRGGLPRINDPATHNVPPRCGRGSSISDLQSHAPRHHPLQRHRHYPSLHHDKYESSLASSSSPTNTVSVFVSSAGGTSRRVPPFLRPISSSLVPALRSAPLTQSRSACRMPLPTLFTFPTSR